MCVWFLPLIIVFQLKRGNFRYVGDVADAEIKASSFIRKCLSECDQSEIEKLKVLVLVGETTCDLHRMVIAPLDILRSYCCFLDQL